MPVGISEEGVDEGAEQPNYFSGCSSCFPTGAKKCGGYQPATPCTDQEKWLYF